MNRPPDLPHLPPRPATAHKGSCGRVAVIGGSAHYAGAALLAARSAFGSGAGYVDLLVPGCLFSAMVEGLPEAIHHPCGDASTQTLSAQALRAQDACLEQADALVIGPGLGAYRPEGEPEAGLGDGDWLPAYLQQVQQRFPHLPLVIDADALNRLAVASALGSCGAQCILTPHPGEAARLLGGGRDVSEIQADRAAALDALCGACAATIVLKGAGTLVGQGVGASARRWRNPTGNPGLATAGTGDVLAGLMAALAARGLSPWDAARLGVYYHGLAADRFAQAWGEDGLRASRLIRWISRVMRDDSHPTAAGEADS